jgi:hypothetical protein
MIKIFLSASVLFFGLSAHAEGKAMACQQQAERDARFELGKDPGKLTPTDLIAQEGGQIEFYNASNAHDYLLVEIFDGQKCSGRLVYSGNTP